MIQELKRLVAEKKALEKEAEELIQSSWGIAEQIGSGLKISNKISLIQVSIERIIEEI